MQRFSSLGVIFGGGEIMSVTSLYVIHQLHCLCWVPLLLVWEIGLHTKVMEIPAHLQCFFVCTHFSAFMCVKFLTVSLFLVCIELWATDTQPIEDAISVLLGPIVHVMRSVALPSLASLKGMWLPWAYLKRFFFIYFHLWFGEVWLWCVSLVMLFGIYLESWIICKLIVLLC